MSFEVSTLVGEVPLTKVFSYENRSAYPLIWRFTSTNLTLKTILDLYNAVVATASQGGCLLKGLVGKPLVDESRAGSTDRNAATEWVVLDLDGLDCPDVDTFLKAIGLDGISYVLQWSASYGVDNKLLRAHVFMVLDKPASAPLLKQWLIGLNHSTPMLRDSMKLTKTGNAISWPLDISACQNDKLIYVAPPTFLGKMKSPVPANKRITLVRKDKDTLSLSKVPSTAENKAKTLKRLDELREEAGLPKRKYVTKMVGGIEVLDKPDEAVITEMKAERGFVYFNLNGGDSWAYYHPENNPDFIFNFKGEPTYRTKELLPDYWAELSGAGSKVNSQGVVHLAFLDRITSNYWRGTYDEGTKVLDITKAKTESQIRSFAAQHGLPLGDFIPEWTMEFDPQSLVRVDIKAHRVNTFEPSEHMLRPVPKASKKPRSCPPNIFKLIHHVVGNDDDCTEHFINWLAFIVQRRTRTNTAWVLHGVPGTGKGQLFSRVLRPIFGQHQTAIVNMPVLAEQFNGWVEDKLLCMIDELQTGALANEALVGAKLKNWVVEPTIPIRKMHQDVIERPNHTNFIAASNAASVIVIEVNDRRYNVAHYQPEKFDPTDEQLQAISDEVAEFYDFLATYPMDEVKARTVLDNDARQTMIALSLSSVDAVSDAFAKGKFSFFLDQLPATHMTGMVERANGQLQKLEDYKAVLRTLHTRTTGGGTAGWCSVARDELRVMFEYLVGNMPASPHKFTSMLKHHRLEMVSVWIDARKERGVRVQWSKDELRSWPQFSSILNPPAPTPPKAKVKK